MILLLYLWCLLLQLELSVFTKGLRGSGGGITQLI